MAVCLNNSRSRALRETMIRTRFAATILKAKMVLNGTDALKIQKELKFLSGSESEVVKKKMRLEELQQRRVAERNAMQQMVLSVEIDQNLESEKQLQNLCGCTDASTRVLLGYPLKRLGLVLKEEFWGGDDDDDDDDDDIEEEGEIIDIEKEGEIIDIEEGQIID